MNGTHQRAEQETCILVGTVMVNIIGGCNREVRIRDLLNNRI